MAVIGSKWHYFNPRSPYGERHLALMSCGPEFHFNPRSPYGERPIPIVPVGI